MPENEVDKFFQDLPSEDQAIADIFNEEPEKPASEKTAEEPEKDDEPRKNRRHRRLEQQLQTEREARIKAEAIAATRAEAKPSESSVDERLFRIFSNDEVGRTGAATLAELLRESRAEAKKEALDEFQHQQVEEKRQEKEFEDFIYGELESIEDEYDVDITSDAPAARKMRNELKELVAKLSPKDEQGLLTGYADFKETFELYQARRPKAAEPTRAKEVAARSMEKPGNTVATPQQPTPGFRGWQKDFHINN